MISIRRVSLGGGFRYLMESVARGDGAANPSTPLASYYAASGTPSGRFVGGGLGALDDGRGVEAGAEVTEEHLWNMLGMLCDPVTGEPLGAAPRAPRGAPVAGFDLTFSPPKSVSTLWALADEATRELIEDCHRRAVDYVLAYAEKTVVRSRSGANGVIEEDIHGVIATAFTHFDSRAGDPQLHDHVVVWNRARSVSDGRWRTLDSRSLYKAVVALSELHQGVLSDYLTEALGVGWDARGRRHSVRPRWEITGVPKRPAQGVLDPLGTGRGPHRRPDRTLRRRPRPGAHRHRGPRPAPASDPRHSARQDPSQPGRSMTEDWRQRATDHVERRPARVGGVAAGPQRPAAARRRRPGRRHPRRRRPGSGRHGGRTARHLLPPQPARRSAPDHPRGPFRRARRAGRRRRTDHRPRRRPVPGRHPATAVAHPGALPTPRRLLPTATGQPRAVHHPDRPRRRSPPPRRRPPTPARRPSSAATIAAVTDRRPGRRRSTRRAPIKPARSSSIATSGAGPRCAGRPGRDRQVDHHGRPASRVGGRARARVGRRPCPLSAAAARGARRRAWHRHREHRQMAHRAPPTRRATVDQDRRSPLQARPAPTRPPRDHGRAAGQTRCNSTAEIARWQLRAGQLVIVDEASLAGTFALDELVAAAGDAGAKVLLVGDWAQLVRASTPAAPSPSLVADRGRPRPPADRRPPLPHRWEKAGQRRAARRAPRRHRRLRDPRPDRRRRPRRDPRRRSTRPGRPTSTHGRRA